MIKKSVIASAVLAAGLFGNQAQAADWSGFYGGAHLGYGFTNFGGVYDAFGSHPKIMSDPLLDGIVAGGQVGYNIQSGSWVYGVEGDISYSDQSFSFIDGEGDQQKGKIDMLASLRGRIGIAADQSLVFLTAGLAYGHAEFEAIESPTNRGKRKNSAIGGVIGGGMEYAVSPMISLRGEVLHYIFYDKKSILGLTTDSDPTDSWNFRNNTVVRAGVNIHLNGSTTDGDTAALQVSPTSAVGINWEGFYGGIHGGYGFTTFGGVYDAFGTHPKIISDVTLDGLVVGGQVGYNIQSGNWVYGVEGDISYSDQSFSFIDGEGDLQKGKIDMLASLRGRIGIAADQSLVFLTAGLAYGHAEFEAIESPTNRGKRKNSAIGGVIGAGMEYAISPMISLRGDVLHYMFYDKKSILGLTTDSDSTDSWKFIDNTVVRVGVNIHLNGM